MNYSEKIGLYYGEPLLADLLSQLNISEKPKLERGDDTAYVSNHALGVELTFKDEHALNQPRREYPEGALVLSNMRFYGVPTEGFSVFRGALPRGIQFGATRQQVISAFGTPDRASLSGDLLSWEEDVAWFQIAFGDNDEVEIVSLQHPR